MRTTAASHLLAPTMIAVNCSCKLYLLYFRGEPTVYFALSSTSMLSFSCRVVPGRASLSYICDLCVCF